MIYITLKKISKSTIMAGMLVIAAALPLCLPFSANAQTVERPTADLTSENFKLVVCDGPDLSQLPKDSKVTVVVDGKQQTFVGGAGKNPKGYVPCNFNTAMLTIQHLIDIALAFGVLASIGTFCYVGYLYITGVPGNITKAKGILPKVLTGFIIMLAAWFIVFQLLNWLGANKAYTALLGDEPLTTSN